MVIYTKGDVIDISVGVEFIERNHIDSQAAHAVVTTEPEVIIRNNGKRQFKWQAKLLHSCSVINYLITEGSELYGPALYSIYSERYKLRFGEEALPFENLKSVIF